VGVASATIYCEAPSKPGGWNDGWNADQTLKVTYWWYSATEITGKWHYVGSTPTLW
jgi:hypothetical protein